MKEGWEYKKLGEVCGKCSNIKWDDVSNEASYRYIDLTSVDRGDLHIHNPQNIRKDNAPSRAKQIIKTGDVIFATTRPTLRRVSIIEEQYDGDICSTGFCVLRHNEVVKSRFVFYALLYDGFYKYIEPLQTGANYPAVTDNVVKNYIIPVPPLPEQQRIVDYLDSAFAKIDAMKANAEKTFNEAQALFQASLKEMLEPKEGWEEKSIKECCKELFAGGDVPKPNVSKIKTDYFSIPIYTNGVENEGLYGYTTNARINEPAVTISARGTIGATFRRFIPFFPAIRLITAIPNNDLLSVDYLYYVLKTLTIGNSGTSIPQLTIPNIKNTVLPIPPLSEQQRIVATLDSLKSKVDRLQANFDKISQECDALKQAILRQVFE